jgi:hypothetical protein
MEVLCGIIISQRDETRITPDPIRDLDVLTGKSEKVCHDLYFDKIKDTGLVKVPLQRKRTNQNSALDLIDYAV